MLAKVLALKLPASPLWYLIPLTVLASLLGVLFLNGTIAFTQDEAVSFLTGDFMFYVLVGLGAQLVDGALGMAYGVTSNSFLLSLGVSPAVSSASVHFAEMFTTGASAISHFRFKNINKKLFKSLLIPGVLGAVTGAYLLSDVIDGDAIKPYIAFYMLVLGIIIIRKALLKPGVKNKTRRIGILAASGGFLDSVGGGGWGPIVTSTLLGQGRDPRYTIGSVNAAEFVIAFSSGVTFLLFNGISSWPVVLGLIVGGVIAAPVGAMLVGKIKRKPLMLIIGALVISLSVRTILLSI
ncbi:sulfite exporter TauE/SafE family protein [Dyadobacter sandarakinus]|uniref:Probable membrane transporter protein n=1 Tax=Dyadobacter sandarakinus TaxID=2747268 RepID=A0ABX7I557_9BACT|nr:sulfite exporter TauE/SafE family protein [Dyadobacter sandarakinus]QRR01070.1 sulfite exporter TauE/SafE family protein [Dyadobacter sandarakinus]